MGARAKLATRPAEIWDQIPIMVPAVIGDRSFGRHMVGKLFLLNVLTPLDVLAHQLPS
jgi:hypothetical protein